MPGPSTSSKSEESDVRFFSVAAVAEMFAISRKHVYELLARGDLHSVHLGKRRLIPRSEVDRFEAALLAQTC